jgi:hypothetical protein
VVAGEAGWARITTRSTHTEPFGDRGEINRARLKTVRPAELAPNSGTSAPIRIQILVGGAGHYLNSLADFKGGLIELLKDYRSDGPIKVGRRRIS